MSYKKLLPVVITNGNSCINNSNMSLSKSKSAQLSQRWVILYWHKLHCCRHPENKPLVWLSISKMVMCIDPVVINGIFVNKPCICSRVNDSAAGIAHVANKTVSVHQPFNPKVPGRFEWNFRWVIFKLISESLTAEVSQSCDTALSWMSLDIADDKSILVQVMAWGRQASSHYLNQCWPRSLSPHDATRSHWVNPSKVLHHSNSRLIHCSYWHIYVFYYYMTFYSGIC